MAATMELFSLVQCIYKFLLCIVHVGTSTPQNAMIRKLQELSLILYVNCYFLIRRGYTFGNHFF